MLRCTFHVAALIVLLSGLASTSLAASAPKRVVILDSFGRGVAPFSVVVSALRNELNRIWSGPLDLYEVSLEAGRTPQPEDEGALVDFLGNRLAENPADLVIPVGAPAVQFAARHRERLFANAPSIITCVDPRRIRPDLVTPQSTVVTYEANLPLVVQELLELLPDTRHVYVIFGASKMEKYWIAECKREFAPFTNRVEFEWWDNLSLAEMKKQVPTLPANSVVMYGLLLRDATGVTIDQERAVRELAAASNAPLVGYYQSQMGMGILGGRLLPDHALGNLVASEAARVLRGDAVSQIKRQPLITLAPTYDWRVLERFAIDEARLPPGSTVLFRPPSLWDTYRWQLIGIGALVVLQSLLITGLLVQRLRRTRAERALCAHEQRLQLITNSLPVLIAYVDRDQRYQFLNLAFQSWFNVDAETAVGQAMWTVLDGTMYQCVRPYAERALGGEQVSFAVDAMLAGGRRLSVEGIHVPDRDEQGQVRGFYGLLMDVTARDQARKEAGQLRDELAHAGRVSLLGVLAGALAHELNQPLAAIMSNAQAAKRFLNDPSARLSEIAEILDDIASDNERASEVIRKLRTLVKKEPADFKSLEVAELIHGVERMVHNDAILRNVSVGLNVRPGLPKICGDRIQLQQVLLNLILNALEATETSGHEERTVTVLAHEQDRQLIIEVGDSGDGISDDIQERLFEPFQSSKQQGLGMGLSISKSIVEMHGGRLWAENNATRGATFYVVLPVHGEVATDERRVEETSYAEPVADGVRGR